MGVFRAFIHEVIRLSAPSPLGMPHYAEEDVMIGDEYCIPKGSVVHNNSYWMHRQGLSDNVIHLEYWLDDNGKFKADSNRFMVFGHGARACPGRPTAMKLMHYCFAILITKYKFLEGISQQKMRQTFAFVPVLEPIGIKLQKRG